MGMINKAILQNKNKFPYIGLGEVYFNIPSYNSYPFAWTINVLINGIIATTAGNSYANMFISKTTTVVADCNYVSFEVSVPSYINLCRGPTYYRGPILYSMGLTPSEDIVGELSAATESNQWVEAVELKYM